MILSIKTYAMNGFTITNQLNIKYLTAIDISKKSSRSKNISALPIPQLSGLPFLGGNMT